MGKIITALMIVIAIGGAIVMSLSLFDGVGVKKIDSFEDCVAANGILAESYPRQCFTQDGKTFTEEAEIDFPVESTETEETES